MHLACEVTSQQTEFLEIHGPHVHYHCSLHIVQQLSSEKDDDDD